MELKLISVIFFLGFGNCLPVEEDRHLLGTLKIRNKRSIRQRAFNRACAAHTCQNLKCTDDEGWHLYGSDWGCCGNYDGCCRWASSVCYYHDVMCKCCTFGWLVCGPDCKPEAECLQKHEEDTNEIFDQVQAHESQSKNTIDNMQYRKPENDTSTLKKLILQNKIVHSLSELKEGIKDKKYRKPKWKKTMNGLMSDGLLMADQPGTDNVDEGSGDE